VPAAAVAAAATAIYLGLPLPTASSGLPAGIGRAALERLRGGTSFPAPPS